MSFVATRLAQSILRANLSDPVSGFFMAKREVFEGSIRSLSGIGNKILVDVFASSKRPLRFEELPYQFKARLHGESKLDLLTAWDTSFFWPTRCSAGSFPYAFCFSALWA